MIHPMVNYYQPRMSMGLQRLIITQMHPTICCRQEPQPKVYYQTLTDGVVNFASDDKITTSTTYNADENVVKEVDETGQVTTTTYGDSKNKNLPTNEVTSNEDGKVSNVTTTYDENGNPLTEKDSVADTETKY